MICNNCGRELEDGEVVCTQCNHDNSPETVEEEKSRINPWRIAFPAVISLALLLVLSWLLYFGVTGNLLPKENNVYYKDSYTATEERINANQDRVVATLGENKLTNSQLLVFYSRMRNQFRSEYNYQEPLDGQLYDKQTGLTWQQYLLQMALNTWKQYQILMDHAKGVGFELPAEYQEDLDGLEKSMNEKAKNNGYNSADEMIKDDISVGCTLADYKYYLERYYWSTLYFKDMTENMEVTDEELEAYFKTYKEIMAEGGITKDSGLLVDMRNILLTPDTKESDTAIAWENCKSDAETLLAQWLKDNPTEESFAGMAVTESKDTVSKANGGLYAYVRKNRFLTVDVRHILIMPEGGTASEDGKSTVYSETEWEDCHKKAQEIYDEYLAGEMTEDQFAELAKKHSKDGNAEQGGIYTDINKNDMVEEFDAWIFDETREPGDTGLVKTQYGYHIMYFVQRNDELDNWLFAEERKAGDYGIFKTNSGYQIVYYSSGEEGWILYCRLGVADEKAAQMLDEMMENTEMETTFRRILLDN